jgi:hypothetical protein
VEVPTESCLPRSTLGHNCPIQTSLNLIYPKQIRVKTHQLGKEQSKNMKFKGLSINEIACNFCKAIILPCLNNQLNFSYVAIFCDVDVTGIILPCLNNQLNCSYVAIFRDVDVTGNILPCLNNQVNCSYVAIFCDVDVTGNILPCLNNQLNCSYVAIFCDVDVTGIILLLVSSNYFTFTVVTTITKDKRLFSRICVAYCCHMLADQ